MTNLRGRILQRQSKPEEVIRNYRSVIRLARHSGNRLEEARACSNLGYSLISHNLWWRSEILACHALDIFDQLEYKHGQAHTYNHLGLLFIHTGEWEKSVSYLESACDIWRSISDEHGLIYGLENLGFLYNRMDRPEAAIRCLDSALKLIQKSGELSELPTIYLNLAVSWKLLKKYDLSEEYATKAEELYKDQGNFAGIYNVWETLGLIELEQGYWQEGIKFFNNATTGFRRIMNKEGEMRISAYKLNYYLYSNQQQNAQKEMMILQRIGKRSPELAKNFVYVSAISNFNEFNGDHLDLGQQR